LFVAFCFVKIKNRIVLVDNFNAIVDVVGSCNRDMLTQISYFYGVKFGDGRYEVKSKDGQGDKEKFMKDVRFASKGKIQELLVARISHSGEDSTANVLEVVEGGKWEDLVALFANISEAQVAEICGKHSNVLELCKKLADGDAKLERLFYAILGADFWETRLKEAVEPKLNKKLLMRVVVSISPVQRAELAKKVDLSKVLTGTDDETKFLKAVF
jgi:hypothetical protein